MTKSTITIPLITLSVEWTIAIISLAVTIAISEYRRYQRRKLALDINEDDKDALHWLFVIVFSPYLILYTVSSLLEIIVTTSAPFTRVTSFFAVIIYFGIIASRLGMGAWLLYHSMYKANLLAVFPFAISEERLHAWKGVKGGLLVVPLIVSALITVPIALSAVLFPLETPKLMLAGQFIAICLLIALHTLVISANAITLRTTRVSTQSDFSREALELFPSVRRGAFIFLGLSTAIVIFEAVLFLTHILAFAPNKLKENSVLSIVVWAIVDIFVICFTLLVLLDVQKPIVIGSNEVEPSTTHDVDE